MVVLLEKHLGKHLLKFLKSKTKQWIGGIYLFIYLYIVNLQEAMQSGILERKGDALSSYYANLMRWRVEMTVSYFLFYEYDVLSIFCK